MKVLVMNAEIICQDEDETIIRCGVKYESSKALLIVNHKGNDVWLPLSQIDIIENLDNEMEICIPNWLIEKKIIV